MWGLLLLVTIPALYWAWGMPGLGGSSLVFLLLAALLMGGDTSTLPSFGTFRSETDTPVWNDEEADPAWEPLIRYRDLAARRAISRVGGRRPFFWLSFLWFLLALYTLVFTVLAGLVVFSRLPESVLLYAFWVGLGVGLGASTAAQAMGFARWAKRQISAHRDNPSEAAPFPGTSGEARIALEEFALRCAGNRLPGWLNLPLLRLVPALLAFVFHFSLAHDLFPRNNAGTAIFAALLAFLAWLFLVFIVQGMRQLDTLHPEKTCPCRFLPLLRALRRATVLRNGGPRNPLERFLLWVVS